MNAKQQKIEWLQRKWLERSRDERTTETHMLMFYAEMQKQHPSMLRLEGVSGDVYQFLKTKLEIGV